MFFGDRKYALIFVDGLEPGAVPGVGVRLSIVEIQDLLAIFVGREKPCDGLRIGMTMTIPIRGYSKARAVDQPWEGLRGVGFGAVVTDLQQVDAIPAALGLRQRLKGGFHDLGMGVG